MALSTIAVTAFVSKRSSSRTGTLLLIFISFASTMRYVVWRGHAMGTLVRGQGTQVSYLHALFPSLLFGAELLLCLGAGIDYLDMVRPLGRSPLAPTQAIDNWSEVDLLIQVSSDPLHIVKSTVLAAVNLDWPPDKLNVCVLDHEEREDVRTFCTEAQVRYLARTIECAHRADLVNVALEQTSAPVIAVFKAHQVPVRSFLQMTVGWLEADPLLGFVQTPCRLYAPDPFQRNLGQSGEIPGEDELGQGVLQDGKDLWNASVFEGTGAVLRRAALDSIGGLATGTADEALHTSVRLHKRGWKSAYVNLPLSAGFATVRVRDYVRQKQEHARGGLQVARRENLLFCRNLNLLQRLCYLQTASYPLGLLGRLLFLVAPFVGLGLGLVIIPGGWYTLTLYAVPHLLVACVVNARLHGWHRFLFWSEIYDTVAAPFVLLPATGGSRQAAEAGDRRSGESRAMEHGFFDAHVAWPLVVLFWVNVLALAGAALRVLAHPEPAGSRSLPTAGLRWASLLYREHGGPATWFMVLWAVFNLLVLTVAISATREVRQRRCRARLSKRLQVSLIFSDGRRAEGTTEDVSSGGMLICGRNVADHSDGGLSIELFGRGRAIVLPATVIEAGSEALRVAFDSLTLAEEEALSTLLYSPADTWIAKGSRPKVDRPGKSLARITRLAADCLLRALRGSNTPDIRRVVTLLIGVATICGVSMTFVSVRSAAQRARQDTLASPPMEREAPRFQEERSAYQHTQSRWVPLDQLSTMRPLELLAPGSLRAMHFRVAANEVIERTDLLLRYRLKTASASSAVLDARLNGEALHRGEEGGAKTTDTAYGGTAQPGWREVHYTLPAELLVHDNALLLRLRVPGLIACEAESCSGAKIELDTVSSGLTIVSRTFAIHQQATKPAVSARTSEQSRSQPKRTGTFFPGGNLLTLPHWRTRQVLVEAGLLFAAGWICFGLATMLESVLEEHARRRLRT